THFVRVTRAVPVLSSIAGIKSSQCWCRASSTKVQSLSPLPRAWLKAKQTGWIAGYGPAPRRSQGRMQSHFTIPTSSQYPRQESNLICDLRKVACGPAHSEDVLVVPNDSEAERAGVEPAPAFSAGPAFQAGRLANVPTSPTAEGAGVEPA